MTTTNPTTNAASNRWANWAGNQSAEPAIRIDVRDTGDIVDAVIAAADRGWRVKPAGTGHSFTAIAQPLDVQLNLHDHSGIIAVDQDTGQVTVRGGTTLHDLNTALWDHGLAMANLGDIDKQTITGAISTATHGTGARFGNLSTQVTALDIVLADGTLVSTSPAQHPDLFTAARVGLGALGVISTLTLQTVPAYLLRSEQGPQALAETLDQLDQTVDDSDHFEFFWFPHTETVYAKRNTRLAPGTTQIGTDNSGGGGGLGDSDLSPATVGALEALVGLISEHPEITPAANRFVTSLLTPSTRTDRSYKVFATDRDLPFVEMEYAVPRAAVRQALQDLQAFIDQQGFYLPMPVEVRFTAADDIPLSTATGRDTAYIAVHLLPTQPHDQILRAIEPVLAAHDGRPHWGKIHHQDATQLAAQYPRHHEFVALRDKLDPTGRFTNPYLDRVLGTPPQTTTTTR